MPSLLHALRHGSDILALGVSARSRSHVPLKQSRRFTSHSVCPRLFLFLWRFQAVLKYRFMCFFFFFFCTARKGRGGVVGGGGGGGGRRGEDRKCSGSSSAHYSRKPVLGFISFRCVFKGACLFVGCIASPQHASVSSGTDLLRQCYVLPH